MEPNKIYLDTNILIEGPKRKEHEEIKNKAINNEVILYISDQARIEQHGKVFPLLRKKDSALRLYDSLTPLLFENKELADKVISFLNQARKDYEKARKDEKKEIAFWKDAKLVPVKSAFAGCFFIGAVNPFYNQFIAKELSLLDKLLAEYKLGGYDATHIIQAYCANVDYFLTWDKSLISKAKKVNWLRFEILTPKEYLKIKP